MVSRCKLADYSSPNIDIYHWLFPLLDFPLSSFRVIVCHAVVEEITHIHILESLNKPQQGFGYPKLAYTT